MLLGWGRRGRGPAQAAPRAAGPPRPPSAGPEREHGNASSVWGFPLAGAGGDAATSLPFGHSINVR